MQGFLQTMTVYLWELALGQTYSGTVAATVPTDAYSGMSGAKMFI